MRSSTGYGLMLLLAMFCGLRLGELLGLRRERVDVPHRRVIVTEQGQELSDGTRHYGQPKTAAGVRTVALPPHLVADVEDHLLRWVGPAAGDLLLTGPSSSVLYRATFNAVWDRARHVVGTEDFNFHDLRHTGNTLAAGAGGEHEGAHGSHGARQRPGRPALSARINGARRAYRRATVGLDRGGVGNVKGLG
jgi:integrase